MQKKKNQQTNKPTNPSLTFGDRGAAISNLMPQVTVVDPILTTDDPSAVEIQLVFIKVDLHFVKCLPSGRTFFSKNLR